MPDVEPLECVARADLRRRIDAGTLPAWAARRYETFHRTMTDESAPYPCYFASEAEAEGLLRYVFPPDSTDEADLARLAGAWADYLDDYEAIGDITSLVVLFEPPEDPDRRPAERYKRQFWTVLEYLNRNDPAPWPARVPRDPEHPKWQFCFAGEPVFVVARAPFYEARRSRHTPHGLEITVQPRGVFEGLSGMTDAGQEARSTIRRRLRAYDDVERHPDMGDVDDPRTRAWKQYMLPETNAESVVRCPLSERPPE